eukprot:CAMPEP_0114329120 /NCGR_PEP_ID=MMETSP0101-20121206/866_1 /TAXON_ID=38822 ORGANISM="Pteridomonas danica, Strain PT" /NCGR_SAMPLE_ID=MMETSP0101 /ASSEMBLY_ACC=CAM_ASM_000211 /LENGTH=86 /DNA_ID=CAMNT_0001458679 /DNA_START=909 /DNA_END=1169 /DNA_ORIENTATION=+
MFDNNNNDHHHYNEEEEKEDSFSPSKIQDIEIITGIGGLTHRKTEAVLPDAMRKFCEEENIPFSNLRHNPGAFIAHLSNTQWMDDK